MIVLDPNVLLMQPDFVIPDNDEWVVLETFLRYLAPGKVLEDIPDGEGVDELVIQVETDTPANAADPNPNVPNPIMSIHNLFRNEIFFLGTLCTFYIMYWVLRRSKREEQERVRKQDLIGSYCVAEDAYFYPMAAIPPPKYNEALEAMLADGRLTSFDIDNEIPVKLDA